MYSIKLHTQTHMHTAPCSKLSTVCGASNCTHTTLHRDTHSLHWALCRHRHHLYSCDREASSIQLNASSVNTQPMSSSTLLTLLGPSSVFSWWVPSLSWHCSLFADACLVAQVP